MPKGSEELTAARKEEIIENEHQPLDELKNVEISIIRDK